MNPPAALARLFEVLHGEGHGVAFPTVGVEDPLVQTILPFFPAFLASSVRM
jgi:hypothetical protein